MSHLHLTQKNGYLIVAMQRGTANALEQSLVDELREVFRSSTKDDQIKGIVLTGRERFFSAGLDLITLYDYDEEQLTHFWRSFITLLQHMTAWPKPLVAAISGHAPAGGCLLALTADYRIMAAGDYQIGLNEVAVGIMVPEAIFNLYRFWIGDQAAHTMLLEGKLVKPDEALRLNMIHEVQPEAEVLARAEKQLQRYLNLPSDAWLRSKTNIRRRLNQALQLDFDEVFGPALQLWWDPANRAMMQFIVEGLKARGKR